MVQSLFQNVTKVTLTTSVVIAILLLLLPLIRKKYTVKWRYWVWLVLAVRLLIPFSPSLPQTPIEITPASQNIEFKVPLQNTMSTPLSHNTAVPQAKKNSAAAQTITLNEILSIVWVLGSAVFMLYHLTGYFVFKGSVWRFSRPVEDKQTKGLWGEVKEEMRISQNIRLLTCKKVQSPMMTGFLKPLLLLPDLDYSAAELKIILRHELIHYKRKDIWYKLLLLCANAVHWFNPLVYLMTAMSNKDIEMVCDSELIRDSDTVFRKQYSETILSAIHKGNLRQTAFSTYFYGSKRIMKERFANIFDMGKKRKGIMALCAIIIAVGIAGAAVAYGVSDRNEQEPEIDMEEYADTSGWKTVDAGLYKFSMPQEWEADVLSVGSVSFTKNGEEIGSLTVIGYDSSRPLSQFQGNHAQTLSTEPLKGCKYPAAKVMIRRTQPAAANDDSYVDELHIYLVPEDSKFAYDLYFDSSLVNEKAIVIAKSVHINTTRIQIQDIAEKWAEAVKNRDGKAQYALLSTELKKKVYVEYKDLHWVTGVSSPWVDGFTVKPGDKTAVISYMYMTSDGFAGYYRQTLSFSKENGHLKVSDYTEPKQADGQSKNTVLAYLEDSKTWLSAAVLREGMFSDMTLSIDGKTKSFPWKTYGEPAFLPELSYADVDGDRRNELIIILCEGEGTGTLVEEIHVFNPEDFSEIIVQNPLDALKKRFESKIDESGVKITIDNQNTFVFPEKEITAQVAEKESWAGNLTMGSIVDYGMKNNHVAVGVPAQLSPAGFLGTFNLTYEYQDHGLKVSAIVFSSNLKNDSFTQR